jgi:hypothetical protein
MTDQRTPREDNKPGVPSDGGNKGTEQKDPRQPGVGGDGGNRSGNDRKV